MADASHVPLRDAIETYALLLADYERTDIDLTRDPDDVENREHDEWHDQHYLAVGREAVEIIVGQLIACRRTPPSTILDFACGSGRVTRHLRAMFPDARIAACDLYDGHVAFCAEQFDAEPLPSHENPRDIVVAPEWDLVFCGSLLTHLPEHQFWRAIEFMQRSLSPSGVAIVTLEGRRAEFIQDHLWKLIEDPKFDRIRRRFHRKGFGFHDYNNDMRRLFPRQQSYGVALAKPSWVMTGLEKMPEICILSYVERAWDDHQDVVVFGRPGVTD